MRRNSTVQASLNRACYGLSVLSDMTLGGLSVWECALTLVSLPDTTVLRRVRDLLARRLSDQLDLSHIKTGPMADIFLTLAALYKYNPGTISGDYLAAAIQRLIASEIQPGGPYRTETGDITIEANAAIMLFLGEAAKPLPNVEKFLTHHILREDATPEDLDLKLFLALTGAYESGEAMQYVADRCQHERAGVALRAAVGHILPKDTQDPQHLLSTRQALAKIRRAQLRTGFWKRDSFFSTNNFVGSPAVMTALMVGALMKHRAADDDEPPQSRHHHESATKLVRQLFDNCAEPLRSTGMDLLHQTCDADKNHEITLLPRISAQALRRPKQLTNKQYDLLGAANLCSWIAYTVYDDFLDGEGVPQELSVANVAMRAAQHYFTQALPQQPFRAYVAKTFKKMDEANAWEVGHCRFGVRGGTLQLDSGVLPSYGNRSVLANRSFAHALGPMGVFLSQLEMSQVQKIEVAFCHYLIARQLNDDLHDWRKDICNGHASYVVTSLLEELSLAPGEYDLKILLPTMRKSFRQTTMQRISLCILQHIEAARQHFLESQIFRHSNGLDLLLKHIETSVHCSLDLTTKSKSFSRALR